MSSSGKEAFWELTGCAAFILAITFTWFLWRITPAVIRWLEAQ